MCTATTVPVDRTVLTSLVIQDHYPAPADGSVPTFAIHESTSNHKAVWDQQLELLHVHKLTEIARVLFAIEMLKVDTSYKGVQQEVSVHVHCLHATVFMSYVWNVSLMQLVDQVQYVLFTVVSVKLYTCNCYNVNVNVHVYTCTFIKTQNDM